MSKSSSGGNDGNSRSSSVEYEESSQQPVNIQTLVNQNGRLETSVGDENVSLARNDSTVPSFPPPSYEHVLEETRMAVSGQSAINTDEDISADNNVERSKIPSDGGTDRGRKTPVKGPEILHKSSKELYKAVAKQWGITCKMSDQCRCFDCQSDYFDCEYERDEQGKTDGGLGAGSPMFLSEVIHGTACTII